MNVKSSLNILVGGTILSAATLFASTGQATIVDLTTAHTSGFINGARFATSDFQTAGTGVIDSFVRIQATGSEQGYNTSGRPTAFDENSSGNFTRNLRLGDIPIVTIVGQTGGFYEFILDINQTNSHPLLSLSQVKIFTSVTGSQTTSNITSLGTLRYNMDAAPAGDSGVELDYSLNSGSGQGDMVMDIPVSAFGAALATDFVYLYSQFGNPNPTNDGFEEWAIRTNNPVNPVPLPAAAGMGLAGLSCLVLTRRRTGR
jgi:hypothetical protein